MAMYSFVLMQRPDTPNSSLPYVILYLAVRVQILAPLCLWLCVICQGMAEASSTMRRLVLYGNCLGFALQAVTVQSL